MQNLRELLCQFIKNNNVIQHGNFKLANGEESDIYLDAKKITFNSQGLYLASMLLLFELNEVAKFSSVGGPSSGADPLVAGMIMSNNTSGFVIRKESKDHGTKKMIEGPILPGTDVAIVEDTVTTGGSAKKAIKIARDFGLNVKAIGSIFFRGNENPFDVPFVYLFDLNEFR